MTRERKVKQILMCTANLLLENKINLHFRFQLPHILGLVCGVMSVVVILATDVQDGQGGVSAGGGERLVGDLLSFLSAALTGIMQVMSQTFYFKFPMNTFREFYVTNGISMVYGLVKSSQYKQNCK